MTNFIRRRANIADTVNNIEQIIDAEPSRFKRDLMRKELDTAKKRIEELRR